MTGSPRSLYRHLLRIVQRLPAETQPYYTQHLRQNFESHSDEEGGERFRQISEQAVKDAAWLLKKYKLSDGKS